MVDIIIQIVGLIVLIPALVFIARWLCLVIQLDRPITVEDDEVEVCDGCFEEVQHLGEDGISFCEHCGCVEGATHMVAESEVYL